MGKKLNARNKILLVAILLISLSACNNHSSNGETKFSVMNTSNTTPNADLTNESKDLDLIEAIRKDILTIGPVNEVLIIKGKKETLVAYKVKHLYRFKMKQIEKDINQQLEKNFPDEEFVISSDLKIFIETNELINQTQQPNFSEKKANKQLQKIITLKNELT